MSNLSSALSSDKKLFEDSLHEFLASDYEQINKLFEAMFYSLGSGGKRIRPVMAIEFCRFFNGNEKSVLTLATALEMVHTYSLIHDDLPCMDNSDYRRGNLTNHKVYGEANALLAGDGLLTHAFGVIASSDCLSSETKVEAIALLSKMAGPNGMVGGQYLDLLGEKEPLTEQNHFLMNSLKTGCLFRTACLFGALASGYGRGSKEYLAADRFGTAIGLAFQIRDDILDAEEDEKENKTTFLTFMTKEEANAKVLSLTEEAKNAIGAFDNADSTILNSLADYLVGRTI